MLRCTTALFFTGWLAAQAPEASKPDPTKLEVPLPAAAGWRASLAYEAGAGVWTVAALDVLPWLGCPELVALDDRGRCTVLRSYSGTWTPLPTIEDGRWLAPVAFGDADPSVAGGEIYTGGQSGRLWQIRPRPTGGFDSRVVAEFPAEEIHTLVLGELDELGQRRGAELLVFLASGAVHRLASDEADTGLTVKQVGTLPGRVREAVVLPRRAGAPPWIASVSRAGQVALLQLGGDRLAVREILTEPMGFGRIAVRGASETPLVLYVTRDDGVVLRLAEQPSGAFDRELIYAGPQGPRGIATGRFHEDPARECVAVFGYSKHVDLLSRRPGQPWQVETIFTDTDKGHWLAAAELDGRNGTDELIGSGYAGRVFVLSRPPGYGLRGAPIEPTEVSSGAASPEAAGPVRVALRARSGGADRLTPLRYVGGFETKTLLYETLVARGEDGRIVPALASSWSFEDGGQAVRFELREGARFHDGTKVTAEAVRQHFRRWVGLPEHDWLRSNQRIVEVRAESERVLRVRLDRPWALLPDLCAINPCAIAGPGSRDREGEPVAPIGSGPFRFVEASVGGQRWRLVRAGASSGRDGLLLDLMAYPRGSSLEPIEALQRGAIDVFVGGWDEDLPADRLNELGRDPGLRVVETSGSSVVYLGFRLEGATADVTVRRQVAAAIGREEILRRAEGGRADPCRTWAAPAVTIWPQPAALVAAETTARDGSLPVRPRLLVQPGRGGGRTARVAALVVEQLGRSGFGAGLAKAGEPADLYVEVTHGVPYDPYVSLVSRFGPPLPTPSAQSSRARTNDKGLQALVEEAMALPEEAARVAVYGRIQERMDREALVVPLYVPRRIALTRATVQGVRLGIDGYRVDLTGLVRG